MAKKSLYPQYSIDEALILAKTIVKHNSGRPMRRLTLFSTISRSPESGPSRALVTASSSYGLTEGGYAAETITLRERGQKIVEQDDKKEMLNAVLDIEVFKAFFDHYKNSTVPSQAAAIDYLKSQGISEEGAPNCLNILLSNGRKVALIQELSGSERIVSYEHAIETLGVTDNLSAENDKESESANPNNEKDNKTETKYSAPTFKVNNIPSININIQVQLPADATPENYEAIFKNIKTYLMSNN